MLHALGLLTLLAVLALMLHALGLLAVLHTFLALVLGTFALLTLHAFGLFALLAFSGLGLAVGALLVGGLGAGLTVLVVLAFVLHLLLGLVHASGKISSCGIPRHGGFELHTVGLLNSSIVNIGLSKHRAGSQSYSSEHQ